MKLSGLKYIIITIIIIINNNIRVYSITMKLSGINYIIITIIIIIIYINIKFYSIVMKLSGIKYIIIVFIMVTAIIIPIINIVTINNIMKPLFEDIVKFLISLYFDLCDTISSSVNGRISFYS